MQVHEMMTQGVKSIGPNNTAQEAAEMMATFNVGALPVCEGNQLVGMVTDRDILVRCISSHRAPAATKVADVMSREPIWIRPAETAEEAVRKLGAHGFRRLPVMENGHLVGMLSSDDIARRGADPTVAEMARQIAAHVHAAV
jgi:CBS domain-containing protein